MLFVLFFKLDRLRLNYKQFIKNQTSLFSFIRLISSWASNLAGDSSAYELQEDFENYLFKNGIRVSKYDISDYIDALFSYKKEKQPNKTN